MMYERLLDEFKSKYKEFCEKEGIALTPGRFLRPKFIFALTDYIDGGNAGGHLNKVLNFAAVVELVHNASLIHDDIIDDELYRRGNDSLYAKFGAKKAVVFGDLIFMKGFKLLLKIRNKNISNIVVGTTIDLCKGELLEMTPQSGRYLEMISLKTASLFKCAARGTASIFHCDEVMLKHIMTVAGYIGSAYQIKDDMRDGDIDFEQWGINKNMLGKHFNALKNSLCTRLNEMKSTDELVNYTKRLLD